MHHVKRNELNGLLGLHTSHQCDVIYRSSRKHTDLEKLLIIPLQILIFILISLKSFRSSCASNVNLKRRTKQNLTYHMNVLFKRVYGQMEQSTSLAFGYMDLNQYKLRMT